MRNLLLVATVILMFGCKSTFEETLNSRDIEKKEKLAFELYEKEDYYKASDLFKSLIQDKKNGEDIEKMFFYYALCDYKMGDYGLAAYEFERLIQKFPRGKYSEESQFYIGMSNYKKSPPSFLDQDYTYRAIESFQLFLDKYPKSDKREEVNKKVDELTSKLEIKMYNQAKLFYNMGEYKSSTVFLENLLNEFPDSKHAEEVTFLIADSQFKLAKKSIESKKIERYTKAKKASQDFQKKYKESDYSKRAENITKVSNDEIIRLKKELPEYYHRIGEYDKSIALYETLLRRSKTTVEQQNYAVQMFKVHHTKCQKANTQNKVENYETLMKFYNELSVVNRDFINNKISKEVESAKMGYQFHKSTAAYQLYKEGKFFNSVQQYKKLLNDTSIKNTAKDWYFFINANYKYALDLEAQSRLLQLDSIITYESKVMAQTKEKPSSYDSKIGKLFLKVKSDLTDFPVALIKEPYQNGKYKVCLGRAQNLLRSNLSKKDEEEIVYLLIAAAVKHAKKGKRFERYERFTNAEKLYKSYVSRVEGENFKVKLDKVKQKIEKGLIKYQIKEE